MYDGMFDLANRYRENSYSPYSHFKVGAAVMAGDGKIYGGANVENASYGLTMCAERVAIFKAISEGARSIKKLLIIADAPKPIKPCGACLQVAYEFGGRELEVVMCNVQGDCEVRKLEELLPFAFGGIGE